MKIILWNGQHKHVVVDQFNNFVANNLEGIGGRDSSIFDAKKHVSLLPSFNFLKFYNSLDEHTQSQIWERLQCGLEGV